MATAYVRPDTVGPRSEFEAWLEDQLERHWGQGFGQGVLVLKLPAELQRKLKKPPAPPLSAKEATVSDAKVPSPSFLTSSRLAGDDECYLIHRAQADREIRVNNVPTGRSSGTKQQRPGDYAEFRSWLGGPKRAKYWDGVDATPHLHQHLGLKFSPFVSWRGGSLSRTVEKCPGIHTPYLYISAVDGGGKKAGGARKSRPAAGVASGGGGVVVSPFAMHAEDSELYSLNYLHAGAPKYWLVVALADRARLERRLRECYAQQPAPLRHKLGLHALPPLPARACSQAVRHMSLWVPAATLDRWRVRYTRVEQRAGELVVTAPGAYHEGWNGGWNVAESSNYGDGASAERARGYRFCDERACPVDAVLRIEWRLSGSAAGISAAAKNTQTLVMREWPLPDDGYAENGDDGDHDDDDDDDVTLDPDAGGQTSIEELLRGKKVLSEADMQIAVARLQKAFAQVLSRAPPQYAGRKSLEDAVALLRSQQKQGVSKRKIIGKSTPQTLGVGNRPNATRPRPRGSTTRARQPHSGNTLCVRLKLPPGAFTPGVSGDLRPVAEAPSASRTQPTPAPEASPVNDAVEDAATAMPTDAAASDLAAAVAAAVSAAVAAADALASDGSGAAADSNLAAAAAPRNRHAQASIRLHTSTPYSDVKHGMENGDATTAGGASLGTGDASGNMSPFANLSAGSRTPPDEQGQDEFVMVPDSDTDVVGIDGSGNGGGE